MPIIDINRSPSPSLLRLFSLALLVFPGLAGWWLHSRQQPTLAVIVWCLGAAAATVAAARPAAVRPLYVALQAAAFPVTWLLSQLIMLLLFFVVMLPAACVMRLSGYDPLQRELDRDADSYWTPCDPPAEDLGRYFRQF